MKISLPWPDRVLHPNARPHWRILAKAKKKARADAFWLVKASGLVHSFPDGPLHLWLDFYPPNHSRRDDDGLLSSAKAAIDGIADALSIDDSRFVFHPRSHKQVLKGGLVVARITGEQEQPANPSGMPQEGPQNRLRSLRNEKLMVNSEQQPKQRRAGGPACTVCRRDEAIADLGGLTAHMRQAGRAR